MWSAFPKTQIFSRDIRVSDWAQWVGSQWIALICSNLKVAVWLQKAFGNSSQSGYIPALVNWQEKQNICKIQLSHTVRVHVLQLLWAQRAGISRLLWWRWIISCSSEEGGGVSAQRGYCWAVHLLSQLYVLTCLCSSEDKPNWLKLEAPKMQSNEKKSAAVMLSRLRMTLCAGLITGVRLRIYVATRMYF